MRLADCCNRSVVIAPRDAGISDVAALMREYHVGCVVIIDGDGSMPARPIGIVTDRDLVVEILAAQVAPEGLVAGDLMQDTLVTGRDDDDLLDALDRMRKHGVRRMPVVDRQGNLSGIVTLDDVLETISEVLARLPRLVHEQQLAEVERRP